MTSLEITNLKYNPEEIKEKTWRIFTTILKESFHINQANFTQIGTDDLKRLFELYDAEFFHSFFASSCKDRLYFRLSPKMTKAGGKTAWEKRRNIYIISLSTYLLFQTYKDIERPVTVNGISCQNRLEAAMRIIEHEIVHLLELVAFQNSSCSQKRFKDLSHNIFGHTGVKHALVTSVERAYVQHKIKLGEQVVFEYEGKQYQGILNRITKRATVMVKNDQGQYRDTSGNRYVKYYVPIDDLKPVSETDSKSKP